MWSTFHGMSRIREIAREYLFELLIAVLGIASMLELVAARDSPGGPTMSLWLSLPAVALLVLPLLARRRFPFAGPLSYWLVAAALSYADGVLIPFVGSLSVVGLAAAFMLGNLRDSRQAGIGLAVIVGSLVVIVDNIPGPAETTDLVFLPLRFAAIWIAGFALRERTEQAEAAELRATMAERERDAAARVAVAEERARIARELHDSVAHAVSVMVLQVGAVRHKLPVAVAEDAKALQGVEKTGRAALTEMRRLLGAMRRNGDDLELSPQPGLDGLDALLDEVGRAGLPVRLHVDGERATLPRAIDLSAYRIIQEGLTNALKHARASHADVTLRFAPDELRIEVRDDGVGGAGGNDPGYGLVGIRERVKIYGGEMSAENANGGGFVLTTRLPISREQP